MTNSERLRIARQGMHHHYGHGSKAYNSRSFSLSVLGRHTKHKYTSEPSLTISQGNRKAKPITLPKPKIPEAYND